MLVRVSVSLSVLVLTAVVAASALGASGPQPPNVPKGETPLPTTITSPAGAKVDPNAETRFGSCYVTATGPDSYSGGLIADAAIHSCPGPVTSAYIDGCIYYYNNERGYWASVGCAYRYNTSVTIPGVCVNHGTYEAWGNAFAFGPLPGGGTFTSSGPWASVAGTRC